MSNTVLAFVLFHVFILAMLALDLGVFHRRHHVIAIREALVWSAVWVCLALLFGAGVWAVRGHEAGAAWIASWLMEKALSVDNLFVFLVIFTYFKVPARDQHSVLFWGILGALLMRGAFIAAGVALLNTFHWTIYVLGAFLVYTGLKMLKMKDEETDLEKNRVLHFVRRYVPLTSTYEENGNFFVRRDGRWLATPLFAVLVLVETTDVVFAVDSVPAALGITTDAFIVYTSNVMAILGLRALFFALSGLMQSFRYLNVGLCVILVFVGVKMLLEDFLHARFHIDIPVTVSLGVVAGLLLTSIIASIWAGPEPGEKDEDAVVAQEE